MRINIFEIPFDAVTEYETLELIMSRLKQTNNKPFFIATPNPEMLLKAQRNSLFHEILNKTDLNIPDGIGVLWASKYLSDVKNNKSKLFKTVKGIVSLFLILIKPSGTREILPQRVTGTDMMQIICKNINSNNKVYLLGGGRGVAEKTALILKKNYDTNVVATNDGAADQSSEKNIINDINKHSPQILFVAFGTPKQELWLARNLPKLKSVKVAIGIGGAFDFISGKTKRAPKLIRKLGLEWLYRLIHQPSRIFRIFNATIRFPFHVIKSSF